MKVSSIVLAAIGGTALAAPADKTQVEAFEILSFRAGSPIQYDEIQANGERFWLNKKTNSFCPNPKLHCPPGKVTAFYHYKDEVFMSSVIEQQVYIDPTNGALKFSEAHGSPPSNAILGGFKYEKGRQHFITHDGGFYACPAGDDGKIYQIYVGIKSFNKKGCLSFETLKEPFHGKGPAAFQYD